MHINLLRPFGLRLPWNQHWTAFLRSKRSYCCFISVGHAGISCFAPCVSVNGTIFSNVTKTLRKQWSRKQTRIADAPPPSAPTRTTDSPLPVDLSSVNHKKVPHINNACALEFHCFFWTQKTHLQPPPPPPPPYSFSFTGHFFSLETLTSKVTPAGVFCQPGGTKQFLSLLRLC